MIIKRQATYTTFTVFILDILYLCFIIQSCCHVQYCTFTRDMYSWFILNTCCFLNHVMFFLWVSTSNRSNTVLLLETCIHGLYWILVVSLTMSCFFMGIYKQSVQYCTFTRDMYSWFILNTCCFLNHVMFFYG